MSQIDLHPSSIEFIYITIAEIHPTTGPVNLSGETVEVALPAVGGSPSSWLACAWASGTKLVGDQRYYVVEVDMDDFTIVAGTSYQPWVRVGGASGAIIKCPDTIRAINT